MAEEERKGSKFLKKSKWGKLFKEDDSGRADRAGTFKLNEDVTDFLKPSTEKSVPKLDIAIAKRWPDVHEVRNAAAGDSQPMVYTKPKRRKGLTVSFVRTLPEIIGEGGDESMIPTSEISRHKALVQRSVSDRRAGSQDMGRHGPRSPPLFQPREPPPQAQTREQDDFRPKPMRRVQTSHDEISPAMRAKQTSPPSEQAVPHRPSLGRIPTGRAAEHSSPDSWTQATPVEMVANQAKRSHENERPRSRDRPTINTQFAPEEPDALSAGSSQYSQTPGGASSSRSKGALSPNDALSPVVQKRREMTKNEGMAFRRASMLIQQGQDLTEVSPPQSGYQETSPPGQQSSSSFGSPQAEVFSPAESGSQPQTALTPDAPNPFADPKYIKRHSKQTTPEVHPDQPQSHSLRQATRQQAYTQSQQQPAEQYAFQPRKSSLPTDQLVDPRTTTSQTYTDRRVPAVSQPQPRHQRTPSREQPNMRPAQAPAGDFVPSRPVPPPAKSQNMSVPQASSRERSASPALRDRIFDSSTGSHQRPQLTTKPNGSSTSVNHFSPSTSHSRTNSRDGSPQLLQPVGSGSQQTLSPQSPQFQNQMYSQKAGSRTSLLGPGRNGPATEEAPKPRESADDRYRSRRSPQPQAVSQIRQDDSERPVSAGSTSSATRPTMSPLPPERGNPAADAAYADFAGRVAHMKGVFRLTAEKEQPFDRCTAPMWLRAGLWWYLKGKSGLEVMLQQRSPTDQQREYLTQAHVDLAKAWWILSDPLESFDTVGEPQSARSDSTPEEALRQGVASLQSHLKSLALSMGKNHLLPPTQSLIQGQDTRLWLDYPRFTPDAAAVLGGNAKNSILVDDGNQTANPYDMLPLGDTRDSFCYGRFPVEVYLNTEEAETDRIVLPCMLTVLRGRKEYQTSLAIASQSELVNVRISPRQTDKKTLSWSDVSWKATSSGMSIRLPRNFDLSIRMQERDFRAVWNLSEYARKVEKSLRPETDEKLIHEARLAELQYADSSNTSAFPPEKLKGCMALIFERATPYSDGSGMRRLHRGYRMLLITEPGHKTLSSASHEICRRTPLYFEYLTDSTANGTTAMVIRVREEGRQCRVLLVFPDSAGRQELYDILNGLTVDPEETIVAKVALASLNIEPASQSAGFSQSGHPALKTLQWQRLGITNAQPDDANTRIPSTVESESLRIVARHTIGCVTDRLNLGKGELQIRLPAANTPTVQILRQPQDDFTMSIDTRNSAQQVTEGIAHLLGTVQTKPTIRTFTFASPSDLHLFQIAITGFGVRYDGLASTLGISRRRMVVPIYKKWEATNVRIQLVARDAVVQLLAFMEDFSHADALCFQVKSTDTFECPKGDSKHNKWGIKIVDAKFSLPTQEKGEVSEEDKLKRRFVNLEGLDYAEEHDDITITFEKEQERDKFAQALPAATSASRGLTLKRRI